MKPATFEYFAPESLDEALELKQRFAAEANVLAGGQSLLPLLNFRLARPQALIDLARVPGLDTIEGGPDALRVGAMTRQRDLELSSHAQDACPLLGDALAHVAHPVIRNRGTVGGSIAHGDAAAELPAALLALGGFVHLRNRDRERSVPASEFFLFHLTTAVEPDELVVRIELPRLPARTGTAFCEFARRHGDFALAGCCAAVTLTDEGHVADARLAYCGVAATPVRGSEAEDALRGQPFNDEAVAVAAALAEQCVAAGDDIQASASYRRRLVRGLTTRALRVAHTEAVEGP